VAPAEGQRPVAAALGSALVGTLYGLILFRVLVTVVAYAAVAALLTAAAVALSVAALSRYRRALLGARKSRVWLPTLVGALAGGGAGIAAVWLEPPGPWLLTFLPVGAFAGGLASFLAEVLPDGAGERRPDH
jgi:hypothetical protein